MKNRILVLFSFLMAFAISMPVFAASEEAATTAAAEEKAPAAEEKAPAETKAPAAEEKAPAETKADPAAKPAEIKTGEEASTATRELLDAARGGKWAAMAAFAIMLLVFIVNRVPAIAEKLGSKAKPWLAAGTSIAGYIAAALLMDHTTIVDAVIGGFMTGASAVGLWEMVFKHFMKPAAPAAAAPSA